MMPIPKRNKTYTFSLMLRLSLPKIRNEDIRYLRDRATVTSTIRRFSLFAYVCCRCCLGYSIFQYDFRPNYMWDLLELFRRYSPSFSSHSIQFLFHTSSIHRYFFQLLDIDFKRLLKRSNKSFI